MDDATDTGLTNSPNINSVLKPPKPRVPLKDLISAVPEEDNTAVRKRRVSFANVNKIKEFSAGAESMVVCQTPVYEEPFSVSSDSSYPSGVEGWTPGKGQPVVLPKVIDQDKENLSVQSTRMSSGMDFTSVQSTRMSSGMEFTTVCGNLNQNTRYSMSGMDLTQMATHPTLTDQQTRLSLGMDLTNIIGSGNPFLSTRYSVGGMDLTSTAQSQQAFTDQRTRFSMGMDMTNVVSHSMQSTRYSMGGMDLTEAVNLQQDFQEQRSARFSIGMEMTEVVPNPGNTMRYSCNEMEFTEAANPLYFRDQSDGAGFSANISMDGSDNLELTEAVGGVLRSAPSPKYHRSSVGLSENVLYSVNNTRFSGSNMDFTSAAGSHLTSVRRKSSRFSLANMDLTEAISNSCDDLEVTEAIGEPIVKVGCSRYSLHGGVDESSAQESPDNMEQTSVVGEQLEYSADTESIVNKSENLCIGFNPPIHDKENTLPNESLKGEEPTVGENPTHVDARLNNMSCVTAQYPVKEVAPNHPVEVYNEKNSNHPSILLNDSHCQKDENSEKLLNVSSLQTELPNTCKKDLPTLCTEDNLKQMLDHVKINISQNDRFLQTEKKEKTATKEDPHFMDNKRVNKSDISIGTLKAIGLDDSKYNKKYNEGYVSLDGSNELKLNTSEKGSDDVPCSPVKTENIQQNSLTTLQNSLTLKNKSGNEEQIYSEQQKSNDDAMEVSLTENVVLKKNDSTTIEELNLPKLKISETESVGDEYDSKTPDMNMSIDDSLVVDRGTNRPDGQIKSDEISDHQTNQTDSAIDFVHEDDVPVVENVSVKDQSIGLNISSNTSLNLSSKSALCSKNITMTRGKGKSFVISPDTSLAAIHTDSRTLENEIPTMTQNTPVSFKTCETDNRLNLSEKSINQNCSAFGLRIEKRGKRSFEAALEPDNDTEESPVKQVCLSKEEPSIDYELLNNVTAPSFLMDTVAASCETLPSLDQHESTDHHVEPSKGVDKNTDNAREQNVVYENKTRTLDDSSVHNMPANPLRHEVIDLCESSFDATSTEVRDLINNSRYKIKNTNGDGIVSKPNENFNCLITKAEPLYENTSFNHNQHQVPQASLLKERKSHEVLNKAESNAARVLEEGDENKYIGQSSQVIDSESGSRRKREKVRSLGNNFYSADFIANFVNINFSIDSQGNVNNVSFDSICTGNNTPIGEYLVKQARKWALPDKGSDLILQLQSMKKTYIARLARSINIICKFYNGTVKGDVLTLEIASCKNHFWTFIDINIKNPEHLSPTDITISKQKIGELKLSHVRKVFNSIDHNQYKLLNFAKAMTQLQFNN